MNFQSSQMLTNEGLCSKSLQRQLKLALAVFAHWIAHFETEFNNLFNVMLEFITLQLLFVTLFLYKISN